MGRTLYDALSRALEERNLTFHDLNDVVIERDGRADNLGDFGDGDIEGYAQETLRKMKDNQPFYAYTDDLIFFLKKEGGECRIDFLPRHDWTAVSRNIPPRVL